MKIGFDISILVYSGSGVATFTYNLVKNLLLVDKKNEYHLFYSSLRHPKNISCLSELKILGAHIHHWRFPTRLINLFWCKFHLVPIELFTGKMDYFHTSDFVRPPLLKGTIGLTTIHDLTWKIFPAWHTTQTINNHFSKIFKTLKYKDIIFCSSQNTKNDLLKLFPNAKNNRIIVNYLGVNDNYQSEINPARRQQILAKYHLTQPYLLYVGTIEPRKNLIRLIKAFHSFSKTNNHQNLHLVVAGRSGWKNHHVYQLVKDLHLQNKVIFTQYIEDQDLPVLYNSAQCCCYLSLYEGFGLPILEAQASSCPVVTSDVASIPEVASDSAVLVNPRSITAIKKGIIKCLKNSRKLETAGLVNSKKFSWKKTAQTFISILN